jgi:UDP-GlcNAc:undecaprenyl-phosphate GlcNAc-1-phosphate transferase
LKLYIPRVVDLNLALLTFVAAAAGSFLLTPLVIRMASGRTGRGIPRIGGAAVVAGFAAGVLVALWYQGYSGSLLGPMRFHWIGWISAALLLFLGGGIDDLRGLGPWAKLAIQCVGASAIYLSGFRIDFISLPGQAPLTLGWMAFPFTLAWVVGVTNAVNLIDGLDGLAASWRSCLPVARRASPRSRC